MRTIAIVLIACQLAACTTWRAEGLVPAEVVTQQKPSAVRVELVDGRREVWYQPAVRGDTLVGFWNTNGETPDRAAPLASIRRVSTNHVDAGRTISVALLVGAFIAAAVAMGNMNLTWSN